MANAATRSRPPDRAGGGGRRTDGSPDLIVLLRNCHILASAVRDVLELGPLGEITPLPLTTPQFLLLKLMSRDGRHQAGEVADILGVSRPAATKTIDKLVRHGLIFRRRSQGDRRATLLTISPKGRRLVQRGEALEQRRVTALLRRFTPAETRKLNDLIERFSVSLLRRERRTRGPCLRCGAYLQSGCPIGSVHGGCPYREVRRNHVAGSLPGGIA